MEPVLVNEFAERIFELLGEKLNAKGKTLHRRLGFANRSLPRRVRRAGAELVDAQQMAENPQIARKIDADRVNGSYKVCQSYLNDVDGEAIRSQRRYNAAAAIAVQVLLVAGALIALLVWRGYI